MLNPQSPIANGFPHSVGNVSELNDLLSTPPDYVTETLRHIDGDVIILGIAGKMGPTLGRMVKRASDLCGSTRRVIGVSRFSDEIEKNNVETFGIDTIKCDLLDAASIRALPDCPNVIYMAGMKFGTTGYESHTWAMNVLVPALVCEKYRRSRIVAFSTGNVYGMVPVESGGSIESDAPNPMGEYAMSCLGRERMFQYFSTTLGIPVSIIRLNYACELRYGVLVDLAQQIADGKTINLSMGHFNVIWQADANAMSIASLAAANNPPFILNLSGPEILTVRSVCTRLATGMNVGVSFSGDEADTAILSNSQLSHALFGYPRVTAQRLIELVAAWVRDGRETLGKPTHFEARDGKF